MEGNLALTYVMNVVFLRVGSSVELGLEHKTRRLRIRDNNQNKAKETDKDFFYVGALGPCYTCSYCGHVFGAGFKREKENSITIASLCLSGQGIGSWLAFHEFQRSTNKDPSGHNVTVNGDRYRAMITNFFIPELNNHDVWELWFQQDGTTCHTARATIDLLKDTFGDRLISRFGPVNWPPSSCDLTPLDYFLWRYVKSLVYADKPQTLYHLEVNIRRVIADIRPQMLEKVIENWTSRLDYVRASRGHAMPQIIFQM
ncbi:uncharacterized protein TNCV_2861261 [Trichonephila clavipes]|nr:uncharacterized protein TNCV_2861261 [Trichonephila clavipes]